jgi:tRNA(Ile2) C34 agmatinyltransferase TiaS
VIFVGIDDTDIIGTPGTNQLARAILKGIGDASLGAVICRHQLFFDPRVPYTSKNGSASIQLPRAAAGDVTSLAETIREIMAKWFVEGSDPGLCIATRVPDLVKEYALSCKTRVVSQEEAYNVAEKSNCYLEGLGGTNQGVVGALAAVGLVSSGEDGRVVHLDFWTYPEDTFSGPRSIEEILSRGVGEIRNLASDEKISEGLVDVGKHLRPNWRGNGIVLYVEPQNPAASAAPWKAVKVP